MFGTALISDGHRASAVVNGEKLAQLNDDRSMVFTITGPLTGGSYEPSEIRGESCGLNIFLSQGLLSN